MSGSWERVAGWIARLALIGVAGLAALLIADGLAEVRRRAGEEARVEVLEERVLVEAEAAEALASELERQTERSLARDARNRRLGYGLLVVSVAFLAAAKWRLALRPAPPPAVLVPLRPPPQPGRGAAPKIPPGQEIAADPDSLDLAFVDGIIERQGGSREAAIPILQAIQDHYRYLPPAALRRVCEGTEIRPSQIAGVASFYAQFRGRPVGRYRVRICHGTACHVAGIGPIIDELRRRLAIPADDDTDAARRFTLESVNCLGCCSLAPVMMVEEQVAGRLTPTSAYAALETAGVEA